ncbi:MAG: UvrB/UvrC motif-containing protein [Actinomycetota bacterium]|nr:UvrB/UvrC motif-containing protein [Actinomycetota bacterium]
MKCDFCNKNKATIYLIKIQDNRIERINICDECAEKFSLHSDKDFYKDLPEIIYKLFGAGSKDITDRVKKVWGNLSYRNNRQCPDCGIDLKTIKKTGLAGCSNCYSELGKALLPLIKNIQGSLESKGKIPLRTSKKIRIEKSIKSLKNKLKNEVIIENFEEAARIRDKIKKLEKSINGHGR